jgi:uncharacterized membrane protein
MRLFVINPDTSEKIYLKEQASSRQELADLLGRTKLRVKDKDFDISEVMAESGFDSTSAGAVAGGLVGALGIPAFAFLPVIGSTIGAGIGLYKAVKELKRVEAFNRSTAHKALQAAQGGGL